MKNKFLILTVILAVIIAGAAYYYFYQYKPAQVVKENQPSTEASTEQTATAEVTDRPEEENPEELKSILDYYLALPAEYIEMPIEIEDDGVLYSRKDYIDVLDEKNYYIHLTTEAAGYHQGGGYSSADLTLFKNKQGPDILAVNTTEIISFWMYLEHLYFLQYENGQWTDVTESVWPAKDIDKDYIVEAAKQIMIDKYDPNVEDFEPESIPGVVSVLPRYGTTIYIREMKTETDIYEIKWDGENFIPKKL